ncbi:MAG: sensor histidine kinase [Salinirussus sp.]
MPHPVIEYASGGDEPTVRRVNPAFRDVFGTGTDEEETVAGDSLSSLSVLFPEEGNGTSPVVEAVRDGEETSIRFGKEATDVAGSFWVRVVPVDGGGYVIFSDAHAVGDAPNRLEMVDFLTHSVRNPLEVAKVHVEVAQESGDISHLAEVQRAHERIDRIAEETIELARQGEVVGETAPTDVADVARDAWQTVRTEQATLQIESPGTVLADEGRLRELLENSFRNAVVHGPGNEDVDPSELTVTVGASTDGFYVADNGTGVPESERGQVTDMGFTTSEEGTGVGLAIVADIAASHGWSLDVGESSSGGARFEFTGVDRVDE